MAYLGAGTKTITMIHTLQSCFYTLHTSLLFTAPFTALLLSHPLYRILLVRENKVGKIKNWDKIRDNISPGQVLFQGLSQKKPG